MEEPVNTTGASAPTDPPKPIVMVLDMMEVNMLWARITPLLLAIDSSTLVIPCPISSLTNILT